MSTSTTSGRQAHPADRTFPITRVVAAVIVPFLLLAFLILYFYPDESGARFAWQINPHMTALFMGAGYLGGAYLFSQVILGRPWHRVAPGFPPVTAFTISMLAATILHWDRFDLGHFPFQLWLILYVVTPFLVPALWFYNRHQDTGEPEAGDLVVPSVARLGLGGAGIAFLLFSLTGFLAPDLLIRLWPWTLSPLTARILGGWFALLAVGGITIARDSRWSAWKIGLQSIGLWHILILVGAMANLGDFPENHPFNWYLILVFLGVAGMVGLYVMMERQAGRIRRER